MIVWNLSRFSRSVKDALTALDKIKGAGGRLVSAVESVEVDPSGRLSTHMLLAIGQQKCKGKRRPSARTGV